MEKRRSKIPSCTKKENPDRVERVVWETLHMRTHNLKCVLGGCAARSEVASGVGVDVTIQPRHRNKQPTPSKVEQGGRQRAEEGEKGDPEFEL